MKFEDLNLYKIGNEIRLTGVIYSDKKITYLCYLPGEYDELNYKLNCNTLDMSLEEWKKFIRQTDLLETEIIAQASDGKLAKIIIRKSGRQIDQRVAWKVFERDDFKCRYCGCKGIPLTVDHLVLWEEGGPTIEDNLVSTCRKCNKQRGNTPYEEWLNSNLYLQKSKNLTQAVKLQNKYIIETLEDIPRVYHKKSR